MPDFQRLTRLIVKHALRPRTWHPAKRLRRKLILSGILPKFSDLGQGAIGEAIEAAGAGEFGRLHKEAID